MTDFVPASYVARVREHEIRLRHLPSTDRWEWSVTRVRPGFRGNRLRFAGEQAYLESAKLKALYMLEQPCPQERVGIWELESADGQPEAWSARVDIETADVFQENHEWKWSALGRSDFCDTREAAMRVAEDVVRAFYAVLRGGPLSYVTEDGVLRLPKTCLERIGLPGGGVMLVDNKDRVEVMSSETFFSELEAQAKP